MGSMHFILPILKHGTQNPDRRRCGQFPDFITCILKAPVAVTVAKFGKTDTGFISPVLALYLHLETRQPP